MRQLIAACAQSEALSVPWCADASPLQRHGTCAPCGRCCAPSHSNPPAAPACPVPTSASEQQAYAAVNGVAMCDPSVHGSERNSVHDAATDGYPEGYDRTGRLNRLGADYPVEFRDVALT